MRTGISLLVGLVLLSSMGVAIAVPPGTDLQWKLPMGTVTFSGQIHADKGYQCMDCHQETFQQKYGADKMTMAGMNEGKWCGKCHNGKTAFSTQDPANCLTCHKQPK
jgi:c(7)-type cytochrome triheme protein